MIGAQSDSALVGQFETTLTGAGPNTYAATSFLGLLAQEQNQGTLARWTETSAGEYLEERCGAEEADRYIEDAQRAAALLPAPLKAWLRSSGAHCNPRIIIEAASLWRRRSR